ncbi:MAG: hypothetical protein LLG24_08475 [Actinomycetia bacterium]|nr:hypothetical protein [Actinomycetes bacterium]
MSEKDSFFDEEEDAKPKTEAKRPSKPKTSGGSKTSAGSAPRGSFFAQNVSMTVASLIAVIALLLGVIIGIVIPTGSSSTSEVPAPATNVVAPSLTQEELQSGQLPPGHPDIGGASGSTSASGSASASDSAETTAK